MTTARPAPPQTPQAPHTPAEDKLLLNASDSSYGARLFDHAWGNNSADLPLLAYDTLQRTNIVHIQNELAKLKGRIFNNGKIEADERESLRSLLRDYGILTSRAFSY